MYKDLILDKKVACFDLDGTIVDTEVYFVEAFSTVLKSINKELFYADHYGVPGIPMLERWKRIIKDGVIEGNAEEFTNKTLAEYQKIIDTAPLELKEGFLDIVFKLREKELKIALTTNTNKETALKVLTKLEIQEAFDFMIFGDEVKHAKPNPEIYLKAAQHFGIKPSEMLVFEDSIAGTEAAVKSGADLIVVWDSQTVQRLFPKEAKLFITRFRELASSLDYTAKEEFELFQRRVKEEQANADTAA